MVIRKAREHVPGQNNLSWGKYVQTAAARTAAGLNRIASGVQAKTRSMHLMS